MEKRQKNKWFAIIGILVFVSLIGINLYANFTDKEITVEDNIKLFGSVITFAGVLLTVVFSSASTKQIDGVKKDVSEVKTDVKTLFQRYDDITEVMNTMSNDVSESDKKLFFVSESIMHREQIINLAKKIESQTAKIFDQKYDLNQTLKDFIIDLTGNIAMIIKNQYDYGFNEFDTNFFKRKLIKQVDSSSEHVNIDNLLQIDFNLILTSIKKNICGYIKELELAKNSENGTRRRLFEESTLSFTEKITFHSLDIYNKKQIA